MSWRGVLLCAAVGVVLGCGDDEGGGKRSALGEPCEKKGQCAEGICAGDGRCRLECPEVGARCEDGTTCYATLSFEGEAAQVCKAGGCAEDRDCEGNGGICDAQAGECHCSDDASCEAASVCI